MAEEPSKFDCLLTSYIGNDKWSKEEIISYLDKIDFIYKVFSIFYIIEGVVIVGYIGFCLVRKETITSSQWMQFSMLLSLVALIAVDYWLFTSNAKFVCGFSNSFMVGCQYILFLAMSFLIAWKFHVVSRGLSEFVLKNVLPSEATKRRNKIIYFTIGGFSIFLWVLYSTFTGVAAFLDPEKG